MRNLSCILHGFLLLTVALSVEASAQDSRTRQRSVRQSERVARAAWRPTRSSSKNAARAVNFQDSESLPVPAPVPDPETSVVEPPVTVEETAPLDGQITLAPLHDAGVACDALPSGECGCGSPICSGCDSQAWGAAPCGSCDGSGCTTCGELCSPNAWRPCVTLCLPQDGWASIEYLGWTQDGTNLPPLVTTSADPNVDRLDAGVLTDPSTRLLFGGQNAVNGSLDGARLKFGVWMDRDHRWGVGAEFFELDRTNDSFASSSTGNPILARPFFNTELGREDSGLIAYPDVVSGSVTAIATSQFSGASFGFRRLRMCNEGCRKWLFCGCPEHFCSRTEVTFGYRYLELEEGVLINESTVSSETNNPGTLNITDVFETRNQFNGLDVGWMYRLTRGYWTFDAKLRLAFGNSRQSVRIRGQTTVNDPTNPPSQTLPGGILAQTTNIGEYRQNEFAVVPEFTFNFGYQMTDHLRATLGYTFIYWSNVSRAGDQISRDINPNLFPPPADPFTGASRPAFAFDTVDYWAQGVNLGLEYRW